MKFRSPFRPIFGILATLSLAACGGSAATNYQSFDSMVAASNTISGSAIQSGSSLQTVALSGNYQHDTGNATVTTGGYTLTDANGFDAGGTLTDGSAVLATDAATYAFARRFSQTYTSGDTAFDASGVIGLATTASDLPNSDTATYTGDAQLTVATNGSGFEMDDGTSTVTANFGTNRVSVVLDSFTTTILQGSTATSAPFDRLAVSNMQISGNRFHSGTIAFQRNGSDIDVLGANATRDIEGRFFGITADASQPDEVGGVVLLTGNDGLVTGAFIAD